MISIHIPIAHTRTTWITKPQTAIRNPFTTLFECGVRSEISRESEGFSDDFGDVIIVDR